MQSAACSEEAIDLLAVELWRSLHLQIGRSESLALTESCWHCCLGRNQMGIWCHLDRLWLEYDSFWRRGAPRQRDFDPCLETHLQLITDPMAVLWQWTFGAHARITTSQKSGCDCLLPTCLSTYEGLFTEPWTMVGPLGKGPGKPSHKELPSDAGRFQQLPEGFSKNHGHLHLSLAWTFPLGHDTCRPPQTAPDPETFCSGCAEHVVLQTRPNVCAWHHG